MFPNNLQCSVVKVIDGDKFDCQLASVQIKGVKMIGFQIPASLKERTDGFATDGVNLVAYANLAAGIRSIPRLSSKAMPNMVGNLLISDTKNTFQDWRAKRRKSVMGLWGENKVINN